MRVGNTVLREDLDMLEKPEASYQVCSEDSKTSSPTETSQRHRHSFESLFPSIPRQCSPHESSHLQKHCSIPNQLASKFYGVAQDASSEAVEGLYRWNTASTTFTRSSTHNSPVNNDTGEIKINTSEQFSGNFNRSQVNLAETNSKWLSFNKCSESSKNGVTRHSVSRTDCGSENAKALLKFNRNMEDSDAPSTKDIFIGSESPETTSSHKKHLLEDGPSSLYNNNTGGENETTDERVNEDFHGTTHPIEKFLQVKVEGSPNVVESGSDEEQEESQDLKACCYCGENYLNEAELTAHVMSEHGETCDECGQVFENTVKLVQHHQVHHLQNDHTCQACGQTYDDSIKLAKHHILEHMGGTSCEKCGEVYPNKEGFDKHPSMCNRCSNTFKMENVSSIPQEYLAETQTDSSREVNRLHVCDSCGKGFTRVTTLKLHKESVHEGVHRYTCQVCGKGFSRGYDLRRHSKFVHEGHQMLPIHKCNECEKRFGRMGDLRRHVAAVHQGLRPHVCDECEKGFTSAVYLKLHKESVHAGLRPHVCTDCGKAFSRTTTLRLHKEAIHDKLYRYSCDVCGKGFTRSTDIRRHKKFVHEAHGSATVYACRECGKAYTDEYDRSRHEKYVHQGHVHVCVNCGDVFLSAAILKKHIETEHNGENDESDEEEEMKDSSASS